MESLTRAAYEYGLSTVLSVGILSLCIWLVKSVVTSMCKRMDEVSASLSKVADKLEKHDERAEVRATYVREEHKQMITTLGRINGYKGGET